MGQVKGQRAGQGTLLAGGCVGDVTPTPPPLPARVRPPAGRAGWLLGLAGWAGSMRVSGLGLGVRGGAGG